MGLERTEYYPISKELVIELRTSPRFAALQKAAAPTSLSWMRNHFQNASGNAKKNYSGHEESTGRSCALFLTSLDASYPELENYYIVVGYRGENLSREDYVGVVASQAVGERSEAAIVFDSNFPWGNISKYNKLKIQTSVLGQPLIATGVSDQRNIKCILDGTIFTTNP